MASTTGGLAVPYVAATNAWAGNDGNWSTFALTAGTPPQLFSVLPSTMSSEIWLPAPGGCEGILANISACPKWRGVHPFEGRQPLGFNTRASSTWVSLGPYTLGSELNLFGLSYKGLYGLDTVTLRNAQSGGNISLASQVIAEVVYGNIWLGTLGLGSAWGEFKTRRNLLSLLDTMHSQDDIPSSSVGYTAGAYYSSDRTPGSLVFGGYDQARFTPSNVTFPIEVNSVGKNKLTVSIQGIVAQNVLHDGTEVEYRALSPYQNIAAVIDSTVATSWLPQSVCDNFQNAFGLQYDNSTGFYLVSDTMHSQLLQMNPSVTFTLSPVNNSTASTNIVLPYAAFDLYVGIPYYNFSTRYFPILVAANISQQTLGRAFLQEAYIFADWERSNFTIGQAIHQNKTTNIVTVDSLASGSSSSSGGGGLSGGAIAGIVVGVVIGIALICALIFFFILRRRRRRRQNSKEYGTDEKRLDSTDTPIEISSRPVHELHEDHIRYELPAHEAPEVEGSKVILEADGTPITPVSPARSRGEMKVQLLGELPRDSAPITPISPLTGSSHGGTNGTDGSIVQLLQELPRG